VEAAGDVLVIAHQNGRLCDAPFANVHAGRPPEPGAAVELAHYDLTGAFMGDGDHRLRHGGVVPIGR
jgi:hypothetical protein